jgi:flagellar hook assembly protein FlgD
MDAGDHEVRWDGKDDRGNRLPAGVYSYRIQSGGSSVARRLVLLP